MGVRLSCGLNPTYSGLGHLCTQLMGLQIFTLSGVDTKPCYEPRCSSLTFLFWLPACILNDAQKNNRPAVFRLLQLAVCQQAPLVGEIQTLLSYFSTLDPVAGNSFVAQFTFSFVSLQTTWARKSPFPQTRTSKRTRQMSQTMLQVGIFYI